MICLVGLIFILVVLIFFRVIIERVVTVHKVLVELIRDQGTLLDDLRVPRYPLQDGRMILPRTSEVGSVITQAE
jgi:hypothetical protein